MFSTLSRWLDESHVTPPLASRAFRSASVSASLRKNAAAWWPSCERCSGVDFLLPPRCKRSWSHSRWSSAANCATRYHMADEMTQLLTSDSLELCKKEEKEKEKGKKEEEDLTNRLRSIAAAALTGGCWNFCCVRCGGSFSMYMAREVTDLGIFDLGPVRAARSERVHAGGGADKE